MVYKNLPNPLTINTNLSDLPSYEIFMNPDAYAFLFSNIPSSLKTYQSAELYSHSNPLRQKIQLRIRGGHAWHWNPNKPSLRIKFNTEPIAYLDLINPEDASCMANPLASHFAQNLNMPYYHTSLCKVYINKEFKGIYNLQHTTASELTMQKQYNTEAIISGNLWSLDIWRYPELWQIELKNLALNPTLITNKLTEMLDCFQRPINSSLSTAIFKYVDMQNTARWSAFQTAIASLHTDDFHNNFFSFNSQLNTFSPIITDPAAFGTLTAIAGKNIETDAQIPIYEFLTPLLDLAFRNPHFQYTRNLELYQLITGALSLDAMQTFLNLYEPILKPIYFLEKAGTALITVPALNVPMRLPVSPKYRVDAITKLKSFYEQRLRFVASQLEQASLSIQEVPCLSNDRLKVFNLISSGHSPVLINLPQTQLCLDSNFDGVLNEENLQTVENLLLYPALIQDYTLDQTKFWLMLKANGGRLAKYTLNPAEQSYLVAIKTEQAANFVNLFQNNVNNAVTNKKITVNVLPALEKSQFVYPKTVSVATWRVNATQ